MQLTTTGLEQDLRKKTNLANQWRMEFNPDNSKQAVEVVFSKKNNKSSIKPLTFNGIPVMAVDKTKHLGMLLDQRLSFEPCH